MTQHRYEPGDPDRSGRTDQTQPVSTAEVADLAARLRVLSAAGRDADDAERERFIADKNALLDRIAAQHDRPEASGDGPPVHQHRAVLPAPVDDDADGWVSEGYEAAHQAYLDHLGHVDAPLDPDDDPYARYAAVEMPAEMRQAAQRDIENPRPAGTPDDPAAIAARIQEIRDRIHSQALDEYAAHQRGAGQSDQRDDDQQDRDHEHDRDERGWQR